MVLDIASHLKLFSEETTQPAGPERPDLGAMPEVLEAFEQLTGRRLKYIAGPAPSQPTDLTWSAPVNPGVGETPGHLKLESVGSAPDEASRVDPKAAHRFATALAGLLGELWQTRVALKKGEAELAAGVPLVPHTDEQGHLAARLQAVLKGGAEAVGFQAAALYLLDDTTTTLKLRSSWGLPPKRLAEPARPLQGALADLEAMLGHAVVLADVELLRHWNAPEGFPAAACVPVSTPTNILGTLWVFSDAKRDLTDGQTNILEVVAGRLASDLEREMLMQAGVEGAELKRQVAAAERMQRNQLPTIPPLLDGWDVAGWTGQAQPVGGDFFDWFTLPDGLVAAAVGDVMDRGIEAALAASTVKAALRSHAQYHRDPDTLLRQVNLTLWRGSAGDQFASMFCGLLETATGQIRYSLAGQSPIVLMRPGGWESLSRSSPPLGDSPETEYQQEECTLKPGEALVIFTDGFRDATDRHGRSLGEAGLIEPLMSRLTLPAKELIAIARDHLQAYALDSRLDDSTILIIKRAES